MTTVERCLICQTAWMLNLLPDHLLVCADCCQKIGRRRVHVQVRRTQVNEILNRPKAWEN